MARIFAYIASQGGCAGRHRGRARRCGTEDRSRRSPPLPSSPAGAPTGRCLRQPPQLLTRSLEDRERAAGVSQCRTGAAGAGRSRARRAASCWSRTTFRRRSLARAFDQAECGVCARCAGYRSRWTAAALEAVRQEFGGQVSTHVRCDISTRRGDQRPAGRVQGAPRRAASERAGRG